NGACCPIWLPSSPPIKLHLSLFAPNPSSMKMAPCLTVAAGAPSRSPPRCRAKAGADIAGQPRQLAIVERRGEGGHRADAVLAALDQQVDEIGWRRGEDFRR